VADLPDSPEDQRLLIDARALASFLIDMPAEWERRGLLRRRKGFDVVWQEITLNQRTWGERAGITASDFEELCTAEEQLRQIQALLPRVQKVAELLEENATRLDDFIQRMVKGIAATIDIRSEIRDDPELRAVYENVRRYRSEPQLRGARTRRKRAAAAEPAAAAPPARDRQDD
jgi:hypothetical protein